MGMEIVFIIFLIMALFYTFIYFLFIRKYKDLRKLFIINKLYDVFIIIPEIFIGLIINFQVLGVLADKKLTIALKDGFRKTKKFFNPKVLIILIGEDIFLMINILNGTFTGLIYFINFIVSLYLINFYFEENSIIERKE